jgi:hypothetical protein
MATKRFPSKDRTTPRLRDARRVAAPAATAVGQRPIKAPAVAIRLTEAEIVLTVDGRKEERLPIALPSEKHAEFTPWLKRLMQTAIVGFGQGNTQAALLKRADQLAAQALGHAEPSSEEFEERLRRRATINKVLSEGRWLTAAQINALQSTPPSNVGLPAGDWKRRGRIFSVNDGGKDLYPGYQFDDACQPLPVMSELIGEFPESRQDPWRLAAWLHYPNAWLVRPPKGAKSARFEVPAPIRPCELLVERPEDVLEAARMRHSYVA